MLEAMAEISPSAQTEKALFSLQDVHSFYGDSHILHGVSLALPQGKAVGLLGRNGMGKTTLIRTLMGYVPARSGRVFADGKDVTNFAPEKMAKLGIGYVPEGRGVFPNLSVKENLLMSARAGLDGQKNWTYERVLETFPPQGTAVQRRRSAIRRRAADGVDWPSADDQSTPDDSG